MSAIRVTILVENTAAMKPRAILGQHGLSYWIEAGEKRVLFDTGFSGDVLLHNAGILGVDLSTADAVVLSHGHLDHVGGLEAALKLLPSAPVFMHPDAPRPKHSGKEGNMRRSDTPYFVAQKFLEGGRRVVESRDPVEIVPGVWMTGEVPRLNDYEKPFPFFWVDEKRSRLDIIPDDQSLYLPTPEGTIVLLGCAHAGIVNTLEYVGKLTGGAPIRCVMGGTHLEGADAERMEKTVAALKTLGVVAVYPGHCTGQIESAHLCEGVGGASRPIHAGFQLEL